MLLSNIPLVAGTDPSVEIGALVVTDPLGVIGPPAVIGLLPCEVLRTAGLFDDGSFVPGLSEGPG